MLVDGKVAFPAQQCSGQHRCFEVWVKTQRILAATDSDRNGFCIQPNDVKADDLEVKTCDTKVRISDIAGKMRDTAADHQSKHLEKLS